MSRLALFVFLSRSSRRTLRALKHYISEVDLIYKDRLKA